MKHNLARTLRKWHALQSHIASLAGQRSPSRSKWLNSRAFAIARLALAGLVAFTVMGVTSHRAAAQIIDNLEFGGGYVHVSGDNGLDGYNLSGGLWVNRRVSLGVDFDSVYDSSVVGVFDTTSIGHTAVKSHLEDYLVGPRVFFSSHHIKKYRFDPFAEVEIGGTHLHQQIQQVGSPTQAASANSFTWLLGGGADYHFNPKWSGRLKLDFMRTHLGDTGQSRLRFGLGIAYTIGARGTKY